MNYERTYKMWQNNIRTTLVSAAALTGLVGVLVGGIIVLVFKGC